MSYSLVILTPRRFADPRGWFSETFNHKRFATIAPGIDFVQDNQSHSLAAGTVRGLHFQSPPHAQAKLVSCLKGSFFDVAVDIREGSPTYGHHVSVILSAENGKQFFIPAGFAHGLMTLEAGTEVHYKVSDYYAPACEGGLLWNDPSLNIEWPLPMVDAQLSPKDLELKPLSDFKSPFAYDGVPMTVKEL